MKIFDINKKIRIICDSAKTRSGFKHTATLMLNGMERESVKVNYLNRTWERYEFQSVMNDLVDKSKSLTPKEKRFAKKWIEGDRTDWSNFETISKVAKMGNVLAKKKKEKNVWKTRMLKAGLGSSGLNFPSDWDNLNENVKQARLDKVIALMEGKGNGKRSIQ